LHDETRADESAGVEDPADALLKQLLPDMSILIAANMRAQHHLPGPNLRHFE
jgi:hypothetical protein